MVSFALPSMLRSAVRLTYCQFVVHVVKRHNALRNAPECGLHVGLLAAARGSLCGQPSHPAVLDSDAR